MSVDKKRLYKILILSAIMILVLSSCQSTAIVEKTSLLTTNQADTSKENTSKDAEPNDKELVSAINILDESDEKVEILKIELYQNRKCILEKYMSSTVTFNKNSDGFPEKEESNMFNFSIREEIESQQPILAKLYVVQNDNEYPINSASFASIASMEYNFVLNGNASKGYFIKKLK